jgi:hypothetical protein
VSGTVLVPAAWSPPVSLEDVPVTAAAGDAMVYLENIAWPGGPLHVFAEQLGASRMTDLFVNNLRRHLAGEGLDGVVAPEEGH